MYGHSQQGIASYILSANYFIFFSFRVEKLASVLWSSLSVDGILPEMYFRNFSYFVNAVYLLLKDQITRREIILADYCLKNFYLHAELYYGISNWSSYKLCGFSLVLTSYFANVEIAFFVYRSFTSKRHAPTMTGKNVTYIANGNFNTFCQQMQIWFRLPDSSIFHVTSSL